MPLNFGSNDSPLVPTTDTSPSVPQELLGNIGPSLSDEKAARLEQAAKEKAANLGVNTPDTNTLSGILTNIGNSLLSGTASGVSNLLHTGEQFDLGVINNAGKLSQSFDNLAQGKGFSTDQTVTNDLLDSINNTPVDPSIPTVGKQPVAFDTLLPPQTDKPFVAPAEAPTSLFDGFDKAVVEPLNVSVNRTDAEATLQTAKDAYNNSPEGFINTSKAVLSALADNPATSAKAGLQAISESLPIMAALASGGGLRAATFVSETNNTSNEITAAFKEIKQRDPSLVELAVIDRKSVV